LLVCRVLVCRVLVCRAVGFASLAAGALIAGPSHAADWPTTRYNAQRNAFSPGPVDATRLEMTWTYRAHNPPSPAWHGPAKWDAYGDVRMHSMRNYDEVPQLIGGDGHVYFGSSVDDTVTCLDAADGTEVWSFFADGPVRIAPTLDDGKIYFGSDDGYAYCLRAQDGELIWKFRPQPPQRLMLNNGRFIPPVPIRSGVIVDEGVAYFAASLLPWSPSYLCAVDARTGSPTGPGCFVRELENVTLEGPLAVSPRLLIAPQGRVPPLVMGRRTGKQLGALDGGGGSFVVVLPNEQIVHGPGNKTGWVTVSDSRSREKLATHDSARALVLDNRRTYLLTKSSIGAVETATNQKVWRVACEDGIELIGVGETLFVGKPNRVEAYSASEGNLLWDATVRGKAYGLSFAGDRLLVSTDLGFLYAFAPTGTPGSATQASPVAQSSPPAIDESQLTPIEAVADERLLGQWVFQAPHWRDFEVANLANTENASIDGPLRKVLVGEYTALEISSGETTITIADDVKSARLPELAMTAAAWVRIDKPQPWGGIVGALQDNGDEEHGWILGYQGTNFCIGLASRDGGGKITYLKADDSFQIGAWHHVVGTYDGQTLQLFVDGKLAATSTAQGGPIRYAAEGPVVIGAYRDKNESFSLTGAIHEVRLYDRRLDAEQIHEQYQQKAARFSPPISSEPPPATYDVAVGPWLQFTEPGVAVIHWHTAEPSPTNLEYRLDDHSERITRPGLTKAHQVRLTSLERKRMYHYHVEFLRQGEPARTPEYECDTFFNYALQRGSDADAGADAAAQPAHREDRPFRAAAQTILKHAKLAKGMCLDWNAGSCELAEELVRRSELRVLCVCRDANVADRARRRLRAQGLYGSRIEVRYATNLNDLALTPHWANLVVSQETLDEGQPPAPPAQIQRVLAPQGVAVLGILAAGDGESNDRLAALEAWRKQPSVHDLGRDATGLWTALHGKEFDGAGQWPYIYGTANNAAYGGESLAGAKTSQDLAVQWIGRPGPRYQADRSGRKTPPLAFGGRLLLEGLNRIVALDIYNGTVKWALEIPHFQRFNIPRDCANWCGAEDSVFAAVRNRCWRIDAETGHVMQRYELPGDLEKQGGFDWGYVAVAENQAEGDLVIGSAVKSDTVYTDFWGGPGWYDAAEGPETHKVCSDAIFAREKASGATRWTYQHGLVINSTITMSPGKLFFVEARDRRLREADNRRIEGSQLWESQYLVALDVATGAKLWEEPLDTMDGTAVFFMAHSDGKLVIVASAAGKFHVYARADEQGAPMWDVEFPWGRGGKADHGSHLSRPAIVGQRLFVRPAVIDLETGKFRAERVPEGKCGTYSCTDYALFFRGDPGARFAMWSSTDNQYSLWDRLRPDCWLSSIPAGGMLLSPEGGGGCSCGSWMETSLGFIPTARLAP
jgi:outer membrane protein assembly factor BamB